MMVKNPQKVHISRQATVKPMSFADFSIPDIPYNKKNLILIFLLGRLWWMHQSEKTLSWQSDNSFSSVYRSRPSAFTVPYDVGQDLFL